jgi:hypothetical protein
MASRRLPPPWSVEELDARFVVTDSTWVNGKVPGQAAAGPALSIKVNGS